MNEATQQIALQEESLSKEVVARDSSKQRERATAQMKASDLKWAISV